jgi:hypothetical protein
MANRAQYESGAFKTAKQLEIKALPPNTVFECEAHEVLRWNNETAEMQSVVEAVWRTRDLIKGKRYVLPADSQREPFQRGLYIEMRSVAA